MANFGRCEAAFPWGGDLQIAPNGDFVILQDTAQSAPATTQRVIQLINTNALDTAYDFLGRPGTLRPDDLFNPNYGSSIRRLLGANATPALLNLIKSRLLAAFGQDAGIAKTPAPTVNVTYVGGGIVVDQIVLYDLFGNEILIPSQSIGAFGTQS